MCAAVVRTAKATFTRRHRNAHRRAMTDELFPLRTWETVTCKQQKPNWHPILVHPMSLYFWQQYGTRRRKQHSQECIRPTPALFLWLVTLTFDLWPQNSFQDSSWNISLSSLVILALAVLRYRADKQTDRQTNKQRPLPYSGYSTHREFKGFGGRF